MINDVWNFNIFWDFFKIILGKNWKTPPKISLLDPLRILIEIYVAQSIVTNKWIKDERNETKCLWYVGPLPL